MRSMKSPASIIWTAFVAAGLVVLPLGVPEANASPRPAAHDSGGAPDTWVPTAAPMSVARSGQTATLLADGKVLIVGGRTAKAELYDPTTRTFAATGSMSIARPGGTATLLADGEVLVAGGCCRSGFNNLSSAELYDPTTGKWNLTGSMIHARSA